jgi:hypothetical protein
MKLTRIFPLPLLALALLALTTGCLGKNADDAVSPDRTTPPVIVGSSAAATPTSTPTFKAPGRQIVPLVTTSPDGTLGTLSDEWTWIDFPDSRCANGSPTGIAVNVHSQARHLVLYLEGGGACDNGQDCWGADPTAVNIASGYDVQQFGDDPQLDLPIFQRSDVTNPLADASYVFVPYCTGDLHAGNGVTTYEVDGQSTVTYHYGAHNLDLYLQRLGGAFPSVDHVWLVGQSAGGFGTLFNQSFVASAFGCRTDVLDDSGPGIGVSGYPVTWNVRLPPGCEDCEQGLQPLFSYGRATNPETRFGFLSFQVDSVLPGFYGASQQDVVDWLGQYEQSFTQLANTQSFVAPGTGHVVMSSATDGATKAAMSTWLTQMVNDDPAWASSRPAGLGPGSEPLTAGAR